MNKKVCFLSPPSRSINHYRPPVALLYLAGYLEKYGFETDIIDITLDNQIRSKNFYQDIKKNIKQVEKETIQQVKQLHPGIVGITCYTPEYFEVLSLAKKIKKVDKDIQIVAGGIHPTFYPQDFAYKGSPFDFAVLGEGEVTLLELVKKIDQKEEWSKIKSIAFPALGCGVGGFPLLASAKIMAQEILRHLREHKSSNLKEIFFCLYDKEAYEIFNKGVLNYLEYITYKL